MDEATAIERLRRLKGIQREFTDFRGHTRQVSEESLRGILAAMGHGLGDVSELVAEAEAAEAAEWIRVLPPVVVLRLSRAVPLTLLAPVPVRLNWRVELEEGGTVTGDCVPPELSLLAERGVHELWYRRVELTLPELPPGYHRFALEKEDGSHLGATRLIVAPERCHEPAPLAGGSRLWGLAVQLYTLRSDRNWGIGDFTDLAGFAEAAAALGADVIGLNPLHALFPADPTLSSPYSPASRNYLNVLYIDPEAIPEYVQAIEAKRLSTTPEFRQRLAALRAAPFVDYRGVTACKLEVLRLVWRHFAERATRARRNEFEGFVTKHGEELEKTSLFNVVQAHLATRGVQGGWPAWPAEYQDPDGAACQVLLSAEPGEVDFHCWLQWIAACQLAAAETRARDAGMVLGLYRDLAVGGNGGGAETWSDRTLYASGASVGAPPDPLALGGQDWGIPPMRPDELRERAYEPFVRLLRANMGRGGALRIDHVMALFRLWWVPAGHTAAAGAYVHYRLDELMAIVALESQRHQCLVIGEDLGTVPPEIRTAMPAHGLYSYRVFFFEKSADGRYRRPGEYPRQALATIATHDLPPLASWWSGTDIALRETLGIWPEPGTGDAARVGRTADRREILAALAREGLWPAETAVEEQLTPALSQAIQLYLARSAAAVMVVQPEDWLGMDAPVNVPGTSDAYPNWGRKLDTDWAVMLGRDDLRSLARDIGAARRE